MKTFDYEINYKKVKNIEIIDNTKLTEWTSYEGEWKYYGECDQNDVPFGIGRAIAKDNSRFIECYFRNGQCHG